MSNQPFPPHPFEHWMRHPASDPKGFLRYYVLNLLKDKSVSGSEIMEEIEKETGGRWKPSPGSVYPFLAWLQDRGYTKSLPKEEDGIKRYMLTEEGERFLKTQEKWGEKFRKKLEFLAPALLEGFRFGINSEKLSEIKEPARRFVMALLNLRMTLAANLSDQTIKEEAEILNESAEKIEEITRRIKKG